MSKKVLITVLACLLLSGVIAYGYASVGKKPYKDLDPSEILSASVRLEPPGKTLPVADSKEIAEYLQDVVIYNRDNSYKTYDGLSVTYTLNMVDGTQTEIMPCSSYFVIDGIGYRTEREPCDALIDYANKIFEEDNAGTFVKEITLCGGF